MQSGHIPGFLLETKVKDARHNWFRENYGEECWELDALPPPVLRERLRAAILGFIDQDAWEHRARVENAERESSEEIRLEGSIFRPV